MSGPDSNDSLARHTECGDVTIRTMTCHEVRTAIDWAAAEGWNPGTNDAHVFYCADPQGFFLACEDDQPVGCCSAVVYERRFASIDQVYGVTTFELG